MPGLIHRQRWATGLLLGAGFGAAVGGALAGEPVRTDPHHLLPPPHFEDRSRPADRLTNYGQTPRVVLRSDEIWRKGGSIDSKLTSACAARQFRETVPLLYRAVFKDEVLGVAFGHGVNLTDTKKLADPRKIYLFRHGDSTGCLVLSRTNPDPAVAAPR
ncbi:conserved hypothetical protein [Azospirillaceae bacterium]